MYDDILVPVGPELTSNQAALDEAAMHASDMGSRLHLLYVWLNDKEKNEHIESDNPSPEPISHAMGYLDDSLEAYPYTVSSKNTSDAIVAQAYELDVDAIVMGTNAATGIKRMALGSVTEATIRKSTLPVIAVNYHGDNSE